MTPCSASRNIRQLAMLGSLMLALTPASRGCEEASSICEDSIAIAIVSPGQPPRSPGDHAGPWTATDECGSVESVGLVQFTRPIRHDFQNVPADNRQSGAGRSDRGTIVWTPLANGISASRMTISMRLKASALMSNCSSGTVSIFQRKVLMPVSMRRTARLYRAQSAGHWRRTGSDRDASKP